jgi:hypothetical protein
MKQNGKTRGVAKLICCAVMITVATGSMTMAETNRNANRPQVAGSCERACERSYQSEEVRIGPKMTAEQSEQYRKKDRDACKDRCYRAGR